MLRIAPVAAAMTLLSAVAALAQPAKDERDLSGSGAMTASPLTYVSPKHAPVPTAPIEFRKR